MKKVILIILYVLFLLSLLLVLSVEFLLVMMGHANWLVIIAVFILGCTLLFKNRWKVLIFTLLILVFAIPIIGEIGGNARGGTNFEKEYISKYIEEKYENYDFEVIDLKFKNKNREPGLEHMFEFYLFGWNNFEATLKEKNGIEFKVYGFNDGFNNITSIVDDFFVALSVNEYDFYYNSNICDIVIGLIDKKDDWVDYYVDLSYCIDYGNDSIINFNLLRETSDIQNIKNKIIDYKFTDDVRVYVTYKFKDGTVKYNNKKFVFVN